MSEQSERKCECGHRLEQHAIDRGGCHVCGPDQCSKYDDYPLYTQARLNTVIAERDRFSRLADERHDLLSNERRARDEARELYNKALTKIAQQESRIDSLRASQSAAEWQPIESAPKMRKLMLGYWNPLGNWRTVLGCYHLDGTLESDTDDSGFAPEGWYESTEAYEYLMPLEQEPTHWMPLPEPPVKD